MLGTILKKKLLILTLVMSVFLAATAVFAATTLISAKKGGVVDITDGVKLVVRPKALEEDTPILADMVRLKTRVVFEFGPDGTKFSKPAELCISWSAIEDAAELTLHGEDGLKLEPDITKWGVKYYIPHFSLYYYSRR